MFQKIFAVAKPIAGVIAAVGAATLATFAGDAMPDALKAFVAPAVPWIGFISTIAGVVYLPPWEKVAK